LCIRIAAGRKQAGLSQTQLAQPLGMSRATISALESGRCAEIGFAKLTALFDLVGFEVTIGPRKGRPTLDDLRAEQLPWKKAEDARS
jgi:transcriptional regulator with XRE-family HTH domain